MLAANIAGLRRRMPGAQFTIISREPEWSAKEHQCQAISPIGFGPAATSSEDERQTRLARIVDDARNRKGNAARAVPDAKEVIDAVSSSDALIISGGGNLCASWPEHVYERAALLHLASIYSKPAIAVGQTIGPDLSETQFDVLRAALGNIRLLGVRDYHSIGVALSLGVTPERIVYQLDDALFLEGRSVPPARFGFDFAGGQPWIAVTIAPFSLPDDRPQLLQSLARELRLIARETGATIILVSHVAGSDEGLSDVLFGRRLLTVLGPDVPALLLDVCSAAETQWLTSKADLVISMRYHPLVFAMAAGVAPLGVFTDYYTRIKLRGALAHADLQDWTMSLSDAVNGDLSMRVLNLWRVRQQVRERLFSFHARWRASEEDRWQVILGAITGCGHSAEGIVDLTGSRDWIESVLKTELADGSWIRAGGHDQAGGGLGSRTLCSHDNRDAELSSVQAALSERDRELASIRLMFSTKNEELTSVKAVLAAREEELASVKAVLLERDRELGSVKPVLSVKEEELLSVKAVLAERDRELGSIKPVLLAKEEELLSVKNILAERERALASVKPML